MNDYIERDVAINAFCSLANALNSAKEKQPFTVEKITISGKISGIYLCKGIIRTTKSADVAPVRHGEWIHPTEYGLNLPEHYCSECGAWEYSDTESNYCPNCGAQMDEEVQMEKRMKEDAKKWEDIEQGLLQIPQDGHIEITSYTKEYLETIIKQLDRIICILGEEGND